MLKLPLWYIFVYTCFMTVPVAPFNPILADVNSDKLIPQRDLGSDIHSVTMDYSSGCCFHVPNDMNDSDDLYLPTYLVPFISSNETMLSDGNCSKFNKFVCISPDCNEDASSTYSASYPHFSITGATRISLKTQKISIADGAWKLPINSSLLYLHDCESAFRIASERTIGQIGLGLSGKAYQNFQTPNPIFSLLVNVQESVKFIFGLDHTFIPDNETGISIACDLDWRIPVNSISIGNSTISTSPMALVFDVGTPAISLPLSHYHNLLEYFEMATSVACSAGGNKIELNCLDFSGSESFPLIFTLENGTQLILPQSVYWYGDPYHHIAIRNHSSTFSGVDYIILGRRALSHFYTVFQQHDDQSTTITLYPLSSSARATGLNPNSLSKTLDSSTSETNNAAPPILEPGNIAEIVSNEPQSQPEVSEPESSYKNKPSQSIFSFVIITISIVIICGVMVFIFRRVRSWFEKEDRVGRQKASVELSESSHFVSDQSNGIDENNDNEIDLSE